MVAALGGPRDLLGRPALPQAPCVRAVTAAQDGHVTRIDGRAIGLAVIALGGGRTRTDQGIDVRVGFSGMAGLGERVDRSRPLCLVHAGSEAAAEAAAAQVRAAMTVAAMPPPLAPPVRERIG
jgi:thymidine phosphorylase